MSIEVGGKPDDSSVAKKDSAGVAERLEEQGTPDSQAQDEKNEVGNTEDIGVSDNNVLEEAKEDRKDPLKEDREESEETSDCL